MSDSPSPPPALLVEPLVRAALAEDLGRAGDITSAATIPENAQARARLVTRKPGRIAGLACAATAFRLVDAGLRFTTSAADGDAVKAGAVLATVEGNARAILAGERVALNFLGHLSGVATATSLLVDEVAGTGARITCTRKTIPGLRALQKYAVRCGGGFNHRFGLDDAVLVKDNHIAAAGGIAPALGRLRGTLGHMVKIEVEVETLEQLREALAAGVDAVLLDNMSLETLRQAVAIASSRSGARPVLEASGNISLETVRAIAETGVDHISSGAITHSARSLDIGLDF